VIVGYTVAATQVSTTLGFSVIVCDRRRFPRVSCATQHEHEFLSSAR
jgi:hypothetical protein